MIRIFVPIRTAEMNGTIRENGQGSSSTWILSASLFLPGRVSGSVRLDYLSSSCFELEKVLNNHPNTTGVYSVDYVADRVVISSDVGFSASFTNLDTRKMFGFFNNAVHSGTVVTSERMPWGAWGSTYHERTGLTYEYEKKPIFHERYSDSGVPYSVGRRSGSVQVDWTFHNEPRENVYSEFSGTTRPFTWQELIRNTRTHVPFFVFFTSSNLTWNDREAIYYMSDRTAAFRPEQSIPDRYDYFNIDVEARLFGQRRHRGRDTVGVVEDTSYDPASLDFNAYYIPTEGYTLHGARVGSWNDQAGAAHLTQSTVSAQPSWIPLDTSLGEATALGFSASALFDDAPDPNFSCLHDGTGGTFFAVINLKGDHLQSVAKTVTGTSGLGFWLRYVGSDERVLLTVGNGTTEVISIDETGVVPENTPGLILFRYTSTGIVDDCELYWNNVKIGGGDELASPSSSDPQTAFMIGSRLAGGTSQNMTGSLGWVGVIPRAITDDEMDDLYAYFASFYDL